MIRPNLAGNRRLCGALLAICAMVVVGGVVEGAAPSGDAAAEATVLEKKTLDAINRGDKTTCAALLSEDFVMLDHEGRKDKAATLKTLSDTPIEQPMKVREMSAQVLSPDVVLVSYELGGEDGAGGESRGDVIWLSSVWARRDGKWLNVFSQTSSAPVPPPTEVPSAK